MQWVSVMTIIDQSSINTRGFTTIPLLVAGDGNRLTSHHAIETGRATIHSTHGFVSVSLQSPLSLRPNDDKLSSCVQVRAEVQVIDFDKTTTSSCNPTDAPWVALQYTWLESLHTHVAIMRAYSGCVGTLPIG